MIRRFQIAGYKSFENAELPLEPLTVLFGPNAAGKSNTFDALSLLQGMILRPTLTDAMEPHRGTALEALRLPDGGLSELFRRSRSSFSLEADVWLSPRAMARVEEAIQNAGEAAGTRRKVVEKFLRYSLTVEFETETGNLRVRDESLLAIRRDGIRRPKREPFVSRDSGTTAARMEGQGIAVRARSQGRGTAVSVPLYAGHHPHISAFREEVEGWSGHHLDPVVLAEDSPLSERSMPGPKGQGLAAALHTLRTHSPDEFTQLNADLQELVPGVERAEVELNDAGNLRLLVHEEGKVLPAHLVSAGTLRVIGLLAVISGGADDAVLCLEEPENGVHPSRLERLADILRGRTGRNRQQIIMNTHSPILADLFSRDHLVLCRKEAGATSFTPVNSLEPLFRRPEIEKTLER
jgi:predicted ATPase